LNHDDVYIVLAMFILAFKSNEDTGAFDSTGFAADMQVNKKVLIDAEREILNGMGHEVWVKDSEYWDRRVRLNEVWEEWGKKGETPVLPERMVFRTRGMGNG
jgi:hypothetical protein